jgi:hypothetical protein
LSSWALTSAKWSKAEIANRGIARIRWDAWSSPFDRDECVPCDENPLTNRPFRIGNAEPRAGFPAGNKFALKARFRRLAADRKLVDAQFDRETWQALRAINRRRMKNFRELSDEESASAPSAANGCGQKDRAPAQFTRQTRPHLMGPLSFFTAPSLQYRPEQGKARNTRPILRSRAWYARYALRAGRRSCVAQES